MKEHGVRLEIVKREDGYDHSLVLDDSSAITIPLESVVDMDYLGNKIVNYRAHWKYRGGVLADKELPIEEVIEILWNAEPRKVEWKSK